MSWYKINEIRPNDYLSSIKPIYSVLEKTHKSKSSEDPFIKAAIIGFNNSSSESWNTFESQRLEQKALEGKMGDFHEELMGKFPGYETYPRGHETGCDVGSIDGRTVMEVKNRDNTMNSSAGAYVVAKLKKQADLGKQAILVQVNCPGGRVNRFGADPSVKVWNGPTAYTFLSNRGTFFDDLLETMTYTFANFKTYTSLKAAIGTP
jgi:hypothetical protein